MGCAWDEVARLAGDWLRDRLGARDPAPSELARSLLDPRGATGVEDGRRFDDLARFVGSRLGASGATRLGPPEVEAAAAVVVLGPVRPSQLRRDPIPPPVWDQLLDAVREVQAVCPQTPVVDVVVAFGLGWRRELAAGATGWTHRWGGVAQFALARLVARSVGRLVHTELVARMGFPLEVFVDRARGTDRIDDWSWTIALELARGRCQCSRRPRGSCRYPDEHRLDRWAPTLVPLQGFLRQAVRGTNQRGLVQAGMFQRGMLADRAEEDVGICVKEVGFWRCPLDHRVEHVTCHTCKDKVDPARDPRVAEKWLLIGPGFPHARHLPEALHVCTCCKNLSSTPECPRHHLPTRGRATAWLPTGGPVTVPWDDAWDVEAESDDGQEGTP